MAWDLFTHAVYGVEIKGKLLKELQKKYANYENYCQTFEDADHPVYFVDWLRDGGVDRPANYKPDDLVKRIQTEYRAGKHAYLHYTGSGEDRPGRCNADPDIWLVGYGMCAFPDVVEYIPKGFFKLAPQWYAWVVGS